MSAAADMDFNILEEEKEAYEILSRGGVAIYEFFSKWQVVADTDDSEFATIKFGKSYCDLKVNKEVAKQIRIYIKSQKTEIRREGKDYNISKGKQKVFWLISKCIQHGIFNERELGKIQVYATLVFCECVEEE